MCPTVTRTRDIPEEQSGETPRRSTRVRIVDMAAELDTGWIPKKYYGLFSLHWDTNHAVTAQIWGRFIDKKIVPNTDTPVGEHRIGDKDNVPLNIDLAQGADGSSRVIDEAAACDEVRVLLSGNITGKLYFGFGG